MASLANVSVFPTTKKCVWWQITFLACGSTFPALGECVRRCVAFVAHDGSLHQGGEVHVVLHGLHDEPELLPYNMGSRAQSHMFLKLMGLIGWQRLPYARGECIVLQGLPGQQRHPSHNEKKRLCCWPLWLAAVSSSGQGGIVLATRLTHAAPHIPCVWQQLLSRNEKLTLYHMVLVSAATSIVSQ